MINWVKKRVEERTSWDGGMLIVLGVIVLIAGPFAKIAAYGAIAYGIWTIWKSEQKKRFIMAEEKKNGVVVKDDHNEFELMLRFFGNEIIAIKLAASNFNGKLIMWSIIIMLFTFMLMEVFGFSAWLGIVPPE